MDNRLVPLQELVQDLTAVPQRDTNTINPEHITMLEGGCRAKKRDSWRVGGRSTGRRPKRQPTLLPRRTFSKLGLHVLPKKGMTFQEALKLHYMWRDYVRESLGIGPSDLMPSASDVGYDPFSKLLVKTDLHGAKIEVIESKCETLVGMIGIVMLDTKNTFQLVGRDDILRTVPKAGSVFCIYLGNIEIVFYGKQMRTRPAERSVKKVKNFIEPFDVD